VALVLLAAVLGVAAKRDPDPRLSPNSPSSEIASPAPPAGRAAYKAQVDVLCRPAVVTLGKLGDEPRDQDAALPWMQQTNSVLEKLFRQWSAVRYPTEDDAQVRAILDPFKNFVFYNRAALTSLAAAVELEHGAPEQDPGGSLQQKNLDDVHTQRAKAIEYALAMDRSIDAYGLRDCTNIIKV
jgi:hypothetical protein